MIWSECKEIWEEGPREYVLHLWNLLDFGMLSIFVASFTARFMAFLKASEAQLYVDQHVQDDTLHNVSLPPEVAYFTYGESNEGRCSTTSRPALLGRGHRPVAPLHLQIPLQRGPVRGSTDSFIKRGIKDSKK